jgi:hypothetical protein
MLLLPSDDPETLQAYKKLKGSYQPPSVNQKSMHVKEPQTEEMFSELWDPKLKCFTEEAKLVCQCLKIEEASLLPGQL